LGFFLFPSLIFFFLLGSFFWQTPEEQHGISVVSECSSSYSIEFLSQLSDVFSSFLLFPIAVFLVLPCSPPCWEAGFYVFYLILRFFCTPFFFPPLKVPGAPPGPSSSNSSRYPSCAHSLIHPYSCCFEPFINTTGITLTGCVPFGLTNSLCPHSFCGRRTEIRPFF